MIGKRHWWLKVLQRGRVMIEEWDIGFSLIRAADHNKSKAPGSKASIFASIP